MTIQEQEERDYIPQSEMELAYEVDRMLAKFQEVNRNHTSWLSSLGFFVVIGKYPVYGQDTDAFLGYTEDIATVTRSSEEVDYNVELLGEWYEAGAEVIYPEMV